MMFYEIVVYFLSTSEWAYSYGESLLMKYVKHFEADGCFLTHINIKILSLTRNSDFDQEVSFWTNSL